MLYVYRSVVSESANELAEALNLNARRVKDISTVHYGKGLRAGDVVVCWGEPLTNPPEGVKVLNGARVPNKFEQAQIIGRAGVPTIEVSRTQPRQQTVYDNINVNGGPLTREQAQELVGRLQTYLNQPPRVQTVWLPRRFNHIGGADLLRPIANPDYFSKKETLRNEYRIHVFEGKSIRAGVKVPREGVRQHEWIRSYDGGWRVRYDGFESNKAMRKVATEAVAALGLNFGAVDIGEKADGTFTVLEVNTAPGIEGGTTETYARAIEKWLAGPTETERQPRHTRRRTA